MSVLSAIGIELAYGGVQALEHVDVVVAPDEIHAIIGPNGAGKTSLLNVCSGVTIPQHGSVTVADQDVTGRVPSAINRAGLARTFQNLQLFPHATALANVLVGATANSPVGSLQCLLGTSSARKMERDGRERAMACLDIVGMTSRADDPAGSLPYGSQRLLEIARALATDPAVLLLDEPGAGFNPDEKGRLADLICDIKSRGTAVIIVEHDMPLVMSISDTVTVLNFGRRIAHGSPNDVSTDPAVIDAYLGADDEGL